jgi:CheY-like chemotaxis protein
VPRAAIPIPQNGENPPKAGIRLNDDPVCLFPVLYLFSNIGRVPVPVMLIVEDEFFTRDIAELMMQDWGYRTLSASDVDEALLLLRSPQQIDGLFTDIYLKKEVLGGCDLAREAKELRPELRVLYTTGNTVTDKMKTLFVSGSHFLRKPYTPGQLQDCVAGMLAA